MITIENQRVLWRHNGVIRDVTTNLNDFRGQTLDFDYEAGDYLYIGTFFPLNHRHFEIVTPNSEIANVTVEVYDGNDWIPTVDIIDQSSALSKSGIIRFVTDKNDQAWSFRDFSYDIADLSSTEIYDKYWMRISWDANLSVGTQLKYIGFKYSDDEMIYGRYPDLNNQQFKNNFEPDQPSGTKTDWTEQHFMAADEIIRDMKRKLIIKTGNQIIDFGLMQEASIHKVAEIIYASLGEGYEENRKRTREYYNIALNQGFHPIDKNMNARADKYERYNLSGKMSR